MELRVLLTMEPFACVRSEQMSRAACWAESMP